MKERNQILVIRSAPLAQFNEVVERVKNYDHTADICALIQGNVLDSLNKHCFQKVFSVHSGSMTVRSLEKSTIAEIKSRRLNFIIIPCAHPQFKGYRNILRIAYALKVPHIIMINQSGEKKIIQRKHILYCMLSEALDPWEKRLESFLTSMVQHIVFGFTKPLPFLLYCMLQVINIVRPVKIGSLNAKGKISIVTTYIEAYMRSVQFEGVRRPFLIVINPGPCPNDAIANMYKRVVWLCDEKHSYVRRVLTDVMLWLKERKSPLFVCLGKAPLLFRISAVWPETAPLLSFTRTEHSRGMEMMRHMEIPLNASYICFGLRDAAYYRNFLNPEQQNRCFNKEDYPDTYIRNPLLDAYIPMISRMASQGMHVLRMGDKVSSQLPDGLDKKIIDYATHFRTAFGDVFMLAHCKFSISAGSGFWHMNAVFNKPTVFTDVYCLQIKHYMKADVFIPSKLWNSEKKRFLTFSEMLNAGADGMRYAYESNCKKDGIEYIHNTPEEITAVVDEMNQRLDGTWVSTEEDEELQRQFHALYQPHHLGFVMRARIGVQFLRENKHLLEKKTCSAVGVG